MCNFMGYTVSRRQYIRLKEIEKEFGAAAALEVVRSGFVYADVDVIRATADKKDYEVVPMHWEFIPPFVSTAADLALIRKGIDPKTGMKKAPIPWLNAKGETLLVNDKGKKAMWADAAKSRRCVLTTTHFFEWRWYKPEGAKKEQSYPYVVDFMSDDEPRYIAGIWTPWTDRSTGETIDTMALVTTAANDLMEVIHNRKKRQPTILTQELAERWLFENLTDQEITDIATYQLPSEYMSAYTIAKDFQTSLDPLQPFEYEELPDLDIAA